MAKLAAALAAVVSLSLAAPVLACPSMDNDETPAPTPRTADKHDKKAAETAKNAPAADPSAKAKASEPKAADKTKANDAAKPSDTKKPA